MPVLKDKRVEQVCAQMMSDLNVLRDQARLLGTKHYSLEQDKNIYDDMTTYTSIPDPQNVAASEAAAKFCDNVRDEINFFKVHKDPDLLELKLNELNKEMSKGVINQYRYGNAPEILTDLINFVKDCFSQLKNLFKKNEGPEFKTETAQKFVDFKSQMTELVDKIRAEEKSLESANKLDTRDWPEPKPS